MFFEYIDQIYIFFTLISLISLIYLSWQDIKSKEISRDITLFVLFSLFSFHIIALFFYKYEISFQSLLGCLILGLPFLLCVLITKEKALGMGDVYLFMIMGLLVGIGNIFFTLSLTVFSALAFSLFKYKKLNLKQKIPLVPFITFGIILGVLFNYFLL